MSREHRQDMLRNLPLDVFLILLDYLGTVDVLRLRLVCKSFYELIIPCLRWNLTIDIGSRESFCRPSTQRTGAYISLCHRKGSRVVYDPMEFYDDNSLRFLKAAVKRSHVRKSIENSIENRIENSIENSITKSTANIAEEAEEKEDEVYRALTGSSGGLLDVLPFVDDLTLCLHGFNTDPIKQAKKVRWITSIFIPQYISNLASIKIHGPTEYISEINQLNHLYPTVEYSQLSINVSWNPSIRQTLEFSSVKHLQLNFSHGNFGLQLFQLISGKFLPDGIESFMIYHTWRFNLDGNRVIDLKDIGRFLSKCNSLKHLVLCLPVVNPTGANWLPKNVQKLTVTRYKSDPSIEYDTTDVSNIKSFRSDISALMPKFQFTNLEELYVGNDFVSPQAVDTLTPELLELIAANPKLVRLGYSGDENEFILTALKMIGHKLESFVWEDSSLDFERKQLYSRQITKGIKYLYGPKLERLSIDLSCIRREKDAHALIKEIVSQCPNLARLNVVFDYKSWKVWMGNRKLLPPSAAEVERKKKLFMDYEHVLTELDSQGDDMRFKVDAERLRTVFT